MSLAAIVAFVVLAMLIAWIGMVLYATFRQVQGESREATSGERR